ncbi:MAG: ABC transporter substrate-binding protein [Pseudomonadota bacterium]
MGMTNRKADRKADSRAHKKADRKLTLQRFLTLLLLLPVAVSASAEDAVSEATVDEPNPVEQIVAQTSSPHEVVERSTQALTDFVESARPWAKEDTERYYQEIESLLSPVVDFKVFARGVMGTHYKRATPEQRDRFRDSFKWGLVKTYSLALTEFNEGEVAVLPREREPDNPKRERVKMEIRTAGGDVFPVVYQLRQSKSGKWRIYNLVVNGVNMGFTFRSQFASAMKDRRYGGDLDKVIDAWATVVEASQDSAG